MAADSALPPDDELVAGLRGGDEARFTLLVDTWSAGLLRVARCLGEADVATELVRDAWLVSVQRIGTFDGASPLKPWVFRHVLDAAHQRGQRIDPSAAAEGPTVDPERFQQDGPYEGHWKEFPTKWPDDEGVAVEVRTQVALAVGRLPDRQRLVLTLRDVEGFDVTDVCTIMAIDAADQLALLHRARAFVRGELETYFASRTGEAPAAPIDKPRALRRRLLPLYAATLLQGIGFWVPVEKLFMTEIGFTAATVGVMAAAYSAVTPLVEVPSGILADRWSRRGVLIIASSALAVSAVVGGLSTNIGLYIASALVLAVYFAMYSGTMEAIVYDTVLEETGESTTFQKQLGRVRMIESGALVGSALIGGWIASAASTRLTYFVTVPFALASIVMYLLFREPRLHKSEESTSLRDQVVVTFKTITRRGLVLPIVVVAILTSLILQVMFEFGPLWLVALSASAVLYGPFWAALVGTLGVGGLLAGKLRFDKPLPLTLAIAVMLGSALTLVLSRNLLLIAIAQVLLALLVVVASIYITSLLHDAVPSSVRSGVASGVGALAWIVFLPFAIVFGLLSEAHGVDSAAWLIVAIVVLAGFTLLRLAFRPHPHRAVVALIPGHLDGTLPQADEERVVGHLAGCAGCRTYVDQLRQTIDALADLPTERLPEPERDSLLASMRSRTSRAPVRPAEPVDPPTLAAEDET